MNIFLILLVFYLITAAKVLSSEIDNEKIQSSKEIETDDNRSETLIDDKSKTLPRKMLARRREEHLQLLKGIAVNPKYEWRYQLVEIGVKKVLVKKCKI